MVPLRGKGKLVKGARWVHLAWYVLNAILLIPIRLIYLQTSLQNCSLIEYVSLSQLLSNVCFNVECKLFIKCLYQPAIILVLSHIALFSHCCQYLVLAFFLTIMTSNITIYCYVPLLLFNELSLHVLSLVAIERYE